MSALDTFLTLALDYELNHQLLLRELFLQPAVAQTLLGYSDIHAVRWEPRGGLFDLEVDQGNRSTFIEVKGGDGQLLPPQLHRQRAFLQGEHEGWRPKAAYVLFGLSTFEHDEATLQEDLPEIDVSVLTYSDVISALEQAEPELKGDVRDLAASYRTALQHQWQTLRNGSSRDAVRLLALYAELRDRLSDVPTRIYRTSNPSGAVVILNDRVWHGVRVGDLTARIYQEANNGTLCIKLEVEQLDRETKYHLRNVLREEAEMVLADEVPGVSTRRMGRLGNYMSALSLGHDIGDPERVRDSVELIHTVHRLLPRIAGQVRVRVAQP